MATRQTSAIKWIVVHHSVTNQLDHYKALRSFSNWHSGRLHPNPNGYKLPTWEDSHIAYHYCIMRKPHPTTKVGTYKTRPLSSIGYHASNWTANKTTIGVCFEGNYDDMTLNDYQVEQYQALVKDLESGLGALRVKPHNYYAAKSCPGKKFDMDKLTKIKEEAIVLSSRQKRLINAIFKINKLVWTAFTKDGELRSQLNGVNNILRDKYWLKD